MARKPDILEIVIRRLVAVCRPQCDPQTDPAGYARGVDQYLEVLSEFSVDELWEGMKIWRREWTGNMWPVPGKLLTFMVQAQRNLGAKNPAPRLEPPTNEPPSVPPEIKEKQTIALGNMARVLRSTDGQLSDAEYYQAVYGDEFGEAHRKQMLERLKRRKTGPDRKKR